MKSYSRGAVALGAVAVVVVAMVSGNLARAQSLDSVLTAEQRRVQLAQASQERVDTLVQQTDDLTNQYKAVMKEIDGLVVYNTLLQRQITNQNTEMTQLSASIDQVTVIERQILPLMTRMVAGLEGFVDLDVPFLEQERTDRVEGLKTLLEQSKVTVSEKFRKVMEAFQIENDYGRTIETYKGTLVIDGATREVDFLKIGRVALLYQTADASLSGRWSKESGGFEAIGNEYRNQIKQGLRIANKQVAPDLFMIPVAAPEAGS